MQSCWIYLNILFCPLKGWLILQKQLKNTLGGLISTQNLFIVFTPRDGMVFIFCCWIIKIFPHLKKAVSVNECEIEENFGVWKFQTAYFRNSKVADFPRKSNTTQVNNDKMRSTSQCGDGGDRNPTSQEREMVILFQKENATFNLSTIIEFWMYTTRSTLNNKKITAMFYVHCESYVQTKLPDLANIYSTCYSIAVEAVTSWRKTKPNKIYCGGERMAACR